MNIYTKQLDEDEVVPAYFDNCFKLIFGDANHLERLEFLLSAIFKRKVKVINLLNTDLIGDNRNNKKNSVDLVCMLDKEYVSVEVNTSFGRKVIDRNLSFLFRLESKELEHGEDYKSISKYYQINLNKVNFDDEYFNVCHIKSENTGKIYSDLIEIYNINLLHYANLCYNVINEEELTDRDKVLGIVGTDKKSVINRIMRNNSVLKEIGDIVKKFSEYDDVIFEYNREKLMMDDMREEYERKMAEEIAANKEKIAKEVTEKVTKEVTKEVAKKKTLDLAKKFKAAGVDIKIISNATGLSIDTIQSL